MPRQFAHHASSSPREASRAITAPPTTSLWPFRYFVVEWTTMSAPSAMGCCRAGERKVLSTTTVAPAAWATAATRRTSVMRSSGLLGVSIQTRRGRRRAIGENEVEVLLFCKRTQQTLRSAVAVMRGDDHVTRLGEMEHERDGRHPGARHHSSLAFLELGQRAGQLRARRVAATRVVVGTRFREALERERGGEMDWRHDGAVLAVGGDAGANGARDRAGTVGCAHEWI